VDPVLDTEGVIVSLPDVDTDTLADCVMDEEPESVTELEGESVVE
jgi:hypothetical protein